MTKFWQSKLFSFNILMVMKTKSIICALAAMLVALGCNKTQDPAYEGTNYIYLSSESGTMYESLSTPYLVDVMLTSTAKSDIELNFEIEGTNGVLEIQGLPLTIKAGEKEAHFSIVSKQEGVLTAPEIFTVKLASNGGKLELAKSVTIPVYPGKAVELTDAQNEMIEAYKTKTTIDLSKYIGLVQVATKITTVDEDTEKRVEYSLTGYTQISLGASVTDGNPVLKMDVNAMGLQTWMHEVLDAKTIENTEFWANEEEEAYAKNIELMNTINWNTQSKELFTVSLDNIRLDDDMNIEFIGKGLDEYEEEITIVPFTYDFSAYTRELDAVKNGTYEYGEYGFASTANPSYWLNCYDIVEVDVEDSGNWIPATASIDNNELKFTFCVNNNNDGDYTRIEASYSPRN